MVGSKTGDDPLDSASNHMMVWHAIVAYVGDADLAATVRAYLLAEGDNRAVSRPGPQELRWLLDRSLDLVIRRPEVLGQERRRSAGESESPVELLAPPDERDLFGSGTAGLSRTLASLTAIADPQRRAVIGKHVCGLTDSEVAKMLAVSDADAVALIRMAEAALAGAAQAGPSRTLEPHSVTTARRFTAIENLPLPDAPARKTDVGSPRPRIEVPTVLAVAGVVLVAVAGLALVAGNSGVERADSSATSESPAATNSPVTTVRASTTEGQLRQPGSEEADLGSALRGPDRSPEISLSPQGEVVRRDLETGEEIWRTAPLGEDVELSGVDLNTVTIRRGAVVLHLSLTDGTFLPP